jgi:uncharacterized protein YdhG (YjbR/CyaY superfamily)
VAILSASSEILVTQNSIDEYIAGFPEDVQKILQKIRATIRKTAPKAEESISYQIPTFKIGGRPLIYFAGFKNHVSVYPAPRGAAEFEAELAAYKGGKGTVQFPLDKRVPYDLVTRIVKFRVLESGKETRSPRKK